MNRERERIGYPISRENAYSLKEAAYILRTTEPDSEEEYYEFLLEDEVGQEGLRTLLELPFEVGIVKTPINVSKLDNNDDVGLNPYSNEYEDKLVLFSGNERSMGNEKDTLKKVRSSKSFLHTHPDIRDGEFSDVPSPTDVRAMCDMREDVKAAIAHPGGIKSYKLPVLDPLTGKPFPLCASLPAQTGTAVWERSSVRASTSTFPVSPFGARCSTRGNRSCGWEAVMERGRRIRSSSSA